VFGRILTHPTLRFVTCLDFDDLYRSNTDDMDLTPLAARRDLNHLTEFTALSCHDDAGAFAVSPLWAGPGLSNLRRLTLGGRYSPSEIVPLARSPHFPRLESVVVDIMDDSRAPGVLVRAFAGSKHFSNLRRIVATGGDGVLPDTLFYLLLSPRLPRLEFVDCDIELDPNGMSGTKTTGPGVVRDLADLPEVAKLCKLRLENMGLGDGDTAPLVSSPHLTNLEYLNVSSNRLTEAGVGRLRARFPIVIAESQRPA
jgi:hypothetical protein